MRHMRYLEPIWYSGLFSSLGLLMSVCVHFFSFAFFFSAPFICFHSAKCCLALTLAFKALNRVFGPNIILLSCHFGHRKIKIILQHRALMIVCKHTYTRMKEPRTNLARLSSGLNNLKLGSIQKK